MLIEPASTTRESGLERVCRCGLVWAGFKIDGSQDVLIATFIILSRDCLVGRMHRYFPCSYMHKLGGHVSFVGLIVQAIIPLQFDTIVLALTLRNAIYPASEARNFGIICITRLILRDGELVQNISTAII